MQLAEFSHSTTLRWTFLVAGLFAAVIVASLGFIYLKAEGDLTIRSDRMIASQMGVFADLSPERRLDAINEHLKQDPGSVQLAGLFDSNGRRIAGNLGSLPPDLKTDDAVQSAVVDRIDESGRQKQAVRLIARSLPNGDVLVIGRNVDEVGEIARVVGRALALGLVPAILLCLAAGIKLSARARKRIVEVNERVQRIIAGNLHERLPRWNADDPFSKLAMIVNGMLDEMETLIHSLAGVGDNIAHDLRTPLTHARLTLERGRTSSTSLEQLQMVTDKTIEGIDQSLSIVAAILRLAEIEKSQRSASFGKVALADVVREVGDMYEPIAEDKGITLLVHAPHELSAHGDRDLLIEAVANLVDNAVKFTPVGGRVEIGLFRGNGENILRVKDTGSGISEHERDAVLRRFYRSDKAKHTSGLGLGLNLVAAIVKLHGFRFTIVPGPGCVVEIACPYALNCENADQRQRARCGSGAVTLSAPAVVAIEVDAGDKAAAGARDPRMERSAHTLHEDAALVLCRSRHGTREDPRCRDGWEHSYILTSLGRYVAPAPGRARAIGSRVSR